MLQLLVQRVVGAKDKAWLTFDLGYTLPDVYIKREPAAPVQQQAATSSAPNVASAGNAERPRRRGPRQASPPTTNRCG